MSKKIHGDKGRHSNIRGNRRNRRSHKHGMFIVRGSVRAAVVKFIGKAADLALATFDLAVGIIMAAVMTAMAISTANKANKAGNQPR